MSAELEFEYVEPTVVEIQSFNEYINSVFPDERIKVLMFKILARLLYKQQYPTKILCFIGSGANSKTVFANFLTNFFGKLLTYAHPPYSGDARIVLLPDDLEMLPQYNTFLSGQALKVFRSLYSPEITYQPDFKMIYECNEIPAEFHYLVDIIPFENRFNFNSQQRKHFDSTHYEMWRMPFYKELRKHYSADPPRLIDKCININTYQIQMYADNKEVLDNISIGLDGIFLPEIIADIKLFFKYVAVVT